MMFIDPKAAMPSARVSARPSASSVARRQAGDHGATRKPSRPSSAAMSFARAASPRQVTVSRRAESEARADSTSASAASACSTSQMQAPQVRPETTSSSRCVPSRNVSAKGARSSPATIASGRSTPASVSRRA